MNRRGLVSTLDAVIFVTILAVAACAVIGVPQIAHDGPDALEICDGIFDARLKAEEVVEGGGGTVYPMADLAAMAVNSGETSFIEGYMDGVMRDAIGDRYGYRIVLDYNGIGVTLGTEDGDPVSSCTREYHVTGGGVLKVSMAVLL